MLGHCADTQGQFWEAAEKQEASALLEGSLAQVGTAVCRSYFWFSAPSCDSQELQVSAFIW